MNLTPEIMRLAQNEGVLSVSKGSMHTSVVFENDFLQSMLEDWERMLQPTENCAEEPKSKLLDEDDLDLIFSKPDTTRMYYRMEGAYSGFNIDKKTLKCFVISSFLKKEGEEEKLLHLCSPLDADSNVLEKTTINLMSKEDIKQYNTLEELMEYLRCT